MRLTDECKRRLNDAPLRLVLTDTATEGRHTRCTCPECGDSPADGGAKKSGMNVVDDGVKKLVKCHKCGFGCGGGTVNIVMKMYGKTFMEACEYISDRAAISLETEEPDGSPTPVAKDFKSFCTRQLEASGLTYEDVMVTALVDGAETHVSPFRRGTLDVLTGRTDEMADEMLILYFDLDGRRRMYVPAKNRSREMAYTRVRWSNPEAHTDRRGRPVKYQTPAGAKTELYFPQRIRSMYHDRAHIETLFVQEGEKKAEKACKHGLPSIAIQGIGNIGNIQDGLSAELQYLVQRCSVKNIVFMMDSDWDSLSHGLVDDDRVEMRPRAFAQAMVKFRRYVGTLSQCGVRVDIWAGHVNENERGDKGIDDLLCNSLAGREEELAEDIRTAMQTHDGRGVWCDAVNITTWGDSRIMDLWGLNDKDDFFERHSEDLTKLHSFRFGDVFYKVDKGRINVASEYGEGKEFWSIHYDDKGKKKVEISLLDIISFLNSNGFRNRKTDGDKRGFVKIERGVIIPKDEADIRTFLLSYVDRSTKDKLVRERFLEYAITKINANSMSMLDELCTTAGTPEQTRQTVYFLDKELHITGDSIDVRQLVGPVWRENQIGRAFEREQLVRAFRPDGRGSFEIELTEAGDECEFLRYLRNTCDFWRGKEKSSEDKSKHHLHLANKISCIGYLLRDWKQMSSSKAVVAMDGQLSEVGYSNGRTGKSLIGKAISKFIYQTEIDGRKLTNDDQYLYSGVTRRTKNIFIDDVRDSFDIGMLYQSITGALNVNIKQGARFVIDFERSPKFYITTNHALGSLDSSAKARLCFMSFSDWYNDSYSPAEEFGHNFWAEWDYRQWQLFDNFMCECIMLYMRCCDQKLGKSGGGLIDPPMGDIELRTLRQEIGEVFLQWAENYYDLTGPNINVRKRRKDVFDDYLAEFKLKGSQMTARTFSKKLQCYCLYSGLHLNATKRDSRGKSFAEWIGNPEGRSFIGGRDAVAGSEYYCISTTQSIIEQERQ